MKKNLVKHSHKKAESPVELRFLLCIAVVFFCISHLHAQSPQICTTPAAIPGEVHVYADPQIMAIGERVEALPDEETTFPGFRVQIYNGNDRNLAQKIKSDVLQLYRDQPVYLIYEMPYFKVRVGDFRDRVEAQKMLHLMKETYKGVLLVPDKINFPETN